MYITTCLKTITKNGNLFLKKLDTNLGTDYDLANRNYHESLRVRFAVRPSYQRVAEFWGFRKSKPVLLRPKSLNSPVLWPAAEWLPNDGYREPDGN